MNQAVGTASFPIGLWVRFFPLAYVPGGTPACSSMAIMTPNSALAWAVNDRGALSLCEPAPSLAAQLSR
jgi:hypothetical protein